MNNLFYLSVFLLILATGDSATASESARRFAEIVNQGNAENRGGNYDAAIAAYDKASEIDSSDDALAYNRAIAFYRKGDIASAQPIFAEVAASRNSELAAKARFNAGNCHYRTALENFQLDPASALEQLQSAIAQYRSALAIDPKDDDARTNIELAAKLLRQLEQQQQRESQQQEQQPKQQEEQDPQSNDPSSKDRKNESEQEQGDSQDQGETGETASDDQRPTEQQDDSGEQSEAGGDPSDQPSDADEPQPGHDPQESQAAGDQSENPNDGQSDQPINQDREENLSSQGAPEDQPKSATSADKANETPQGELAEASPQDAKDDGQQVATIPSSDIDGQMTEQEARKMLQAIRDRDMLRRMRRQAAERQRHVPVEKDW